MSKTAEEAYEQYKAEEKDRGRFIMPYARRDFLNGWNAAIEQAIKEVQDEKVS
jgi:hypothetical protein